MKRVDIRWNLVEEFNRMNLVQDERTEQEAEKDRKISLVWTAALLVLLLWPLRDEGTSRGFALVDLCAVALRAVLDWRALHGGSFLLTGKTVTAWNGLSRALLGGIWTGAALYYLLGARSLLTALGSLPLGCSLYGVYLALAQTHVMNRAKRDDPEGWWPNEHPGRGLAVLLGMAAVGLAMMAAGWNFG